MLVAVRQMRENNHVEDINFQRELETLFFHTSLTANIKFFLNNNLKQNCKRWVCIIILYELILIFNTNKFTNNTLLLIQILLINLKVYNFVFIF